MKISQFLGMLPALILLGSCAGGTPVSEIIACGDNRLIILDSEASNADSLAVVWQWSSDEAKDQLPAKYQNYLRTIDDCKLYDDASLLLFTSSSDATVLLDRNSRKVLFYAYTPMAHSAEMLPDGRIVVALSTDDGGNSIELYDRFHSEQVIWRDSLYSGHGVLWNDSRQRLYALGYDELREYSLSDWDSVTPSLQLEKSYKIPLEGGHDLSPMCEDEMLITAHDGVVVFNLDNEQFTPFAPLATTVNVKSVNYDKATERLIYTKAEERWWTHNIYYENPRKVVKIDDMCLYKVRVIKNTL